MAMSSFLHQECQLLPYLLFFQVLQFQKEIRRQNTQILIAILLLFTTFHYKVNIVETTEKHTEQNKNSFIVKIAFSIA